MATSDTGICNLALRHLAAATIASLTERSAPAKACTDFYPQTRDEVLEDFPWPFCTVIDNLALVAEQPNNEWAFSYQYPDAIAFRRILSGSRVDTHQSRVPFRIANGASGKLIFTDMPDAQGEWTVHVTDAAAFSAAFVQALALKLAGYLGPTIGSESAVRLADRAAAKYEQQIQQARANALNEEQADLDPEAEWIRARDGAPSTPNIFQQPL